ncbi:MAG: TetR family transcriptional regulator [Nocardioides sp.]|nr:TetR family transcriptional regulator [Nocardioides sp.]
MTSLRHNSPDPSDPRDGYLDAARGLLLDVGWKRTTLTEVARRAGVSRMTIYRTWADMPKLLGDLMTREWSGVVTAALTSGPDDAPLPDGPVDRLVETVVRCVRLLRENELFVRILEVDPELVLPYLLSRRGRSQDLVLEVLEQAVRDGQEAGAVRAGNPVAIARGVLLAAHGFVLSAHTMVDDRVSEQEVDAELALVVRACLVPGSSTSRGSAR